jgi:hypothetical protein
MKVSGYFQYLQDSGYIEYGTTIPAHVIIKIIGSEPEEGWEFLGPFLQLKENIESQGYFCTTSGCNSGALRILQLTEMTDRVESIQRLLIRKQKKALTTMLNCENSQLSEYERARQELATNKLSLGLQALHSVIYNVA